MPVQVRRRWSCTKNTSPKSKGPRASVSHSEFPELSVLGSHPTTLADGGAGASCLPGLVKDRQRYPTHETATRYSQHKHLDRMGLWGRAYAPHVRPMSHMPIHRDVSETAGAQSLDRRRPCSCPPGAACPTAETQSIPGPDHRLGLLPCCPCSVASGITAKPTCRKPVGVMFAEAQKNEFDCGRGRDDLWNWW